MNLRITSNEFSVCERFSLQIDHHKATQVA